MGSSWSHTCHRVLNECPIGHSFFFICLYLLTKSVISCILSFTTWRERCIRPRQSPFPLHMVCGGKQRSQPVTRRRTHDDARALRRSDRLFQGSAGSLRPHLRPRRQRRRHHARPRSPRRRPRLALRRQRPSINCRWEPAERNSSRESTRWLAAITRKSPHSRGLFSYSSSDSPAVCSINVACSCAPARARRWVCSTCARMSFFI